MRVLLAVSMFLCATSALAAQNGTVSGTVTVLSSRSNPYAAAGYETARPPRARQRIPAEADTIVPLKEAQLVVYITDGNQTRGVFFSRTNAEGQYSIPWAVATNGSLMTVRAFLIRPNLNEGQVTTSTPPYSFRVEDSVILGQNTLTQFTGLRTSDLTFTAQQSIHVAAFQSAVEVYALFDNQGPPPSGPTIRADTSGVIIELSMPPNIDFLTNFAPTDSNVYIRPTAATNGRTVAHELGHILAWNSLDLPQAVIVPSDYWCVFPNLPDAYPAWSAYSRECEKAAFHDGFADFVSAAWMWYRDASGVEPETGRTIPRVSTSDGDLNIEAAGICGTTNPATRSKNVPFCTSRALWDIFDNPVGDDDGIQNRDLSDIVGAFRAYPRNCVPCFSDNRCSTEGYPYNQFCGSSELDANNWLDFAFNYKTSIGQTTAVNAITAANGLTGQSD